MNSTAAIAAFDHSDGLQTLPGSRRIAAAATRRSSAIISKVLVERHEGREQLVNGSSYSPVEAYSPAPELRPLAVNKTASFTVAKEWEGVVENVGISHFTAQLREVRAQTDDTDLAELPIGDISRQEWDLLKEGAVFRYLAGYAQDVRGTVTRKRLVYFRKGRVRTGIDKEAQWLEIAALFANE